MRYTDKLYGKVEITEPLLLDLMASKAMQRASNIAQHGITALLGITPPFSRFDHSVGTMLLVRSLGADIHEQVAALLHDISHTAFSHVIDYVFDDHDTQGFHEEKKETFVANTDIPSILRKYGFDWRDYMDEQHFLLLEQPSPALCADRLDYFFRDLEYLKLANNDEIKNALKSLDVVDGRIGVKTVTAARWLAYTYIEADRASWSNFREVGLYQVTAEAIKCATRLDFLKEADFWETDQTLWNKLLSIDHPEVKRWIEMLTPGTRFNWNEEQPLFSVSTKVRSIDPPVIIDGSLKHLSSLDLVFSQYRTQYLTSKEGEWPMEVVYLQNE